METAQNPEIPKLLRPTFYLCAGVAGAGCTTAVENIARFRIALPGPGQVVSRIARAGEIHAGNRNNPNEYKQYYFVKPDKMKRVKTILTTYREKYLNIYGFTPAAVEGIRKTLATANVIIDALGSKSDWQMLLDDKPVVMLYFAPDNLESTRDRIRNRMNVAGRRIDEAELTDRVKANAINIGQEIRAYDYWIDTTDFDSVVPAVRSVIALSSYGEVGPLHPHVISISENPARIDKLIRDYQTASL